MTIWTTNELTRIEEVDELELASWHAQRLRQILVVTANCGARAWPPDVNLEVISQLP